jgi:uncharacterized membrane protein
MNKTLLVVLTFLSVCFCACKHLPPETAAPGGGGTGIGTGGGGNGGGAGSNAVCFQSDILPIFQSNCAKSGCHDAASNQKGYILDSYDNLFNKDGRFEQSNIKVNYPEDSKLYQVLFETGNKKMPPLPNPDLTTVQKNLIARWITEGAKNTTNCNTTCDSTQFKFSANIMPLVQNHCTGCHSGAAPPNGVNLTTYDGVRFVAVGGLLYGVVSQSPGYDPMPKGSGKLSDCEIAQIKKWVQAGSLNN